MGEDSHVRRFVRKLQISPHTKKEHRGGVDVARGDAVRTPVPLRCVTKGMQSLIITPRADTPI